MNGIRDFRPFGLNFRDGIEELDRASLTIRLASAPIPISGLDNVDVVWSEDAGILQIKASSEDFPQQETCLRAQKLFFSVVKELERQLGPSTSFCKLRRDKQVWYEMIGGNLFYQASWVQSCEPVETGLAAVFVRIVPMADAESRVEALFQFLPEELVSEA